FQITSKAGTLSANDSMTKRAALAAITHHSPTRAIGAGSVIRPACESRPSVMMTADRLRPAANAIAIASARISSVDGIGRLLHWPGPVPATGYRLQATGWRLAVATSGLRAGRRRHDRRRCRGHRPLHRRNRDRRRPEDALR